MMLFSPALRATIRISSAMLFGALSMAAQTLNPAPFGPNVFVFNPSMSSQQMQTQIDSVYASQKNAEFNSKRFAFLLKPGEYKLDLPIGFYTQVIGLGANPDDVHITGNVHIDAALPNNNATTTFWRGAEGFSVTPSNGTLQWAVSQAIFFRRMHVHGSMVLHQKHGWASGGWISDSVIDGNVDSGSQQQWISRNAEWKSWTGSNWNQCFVGVPQAPSGDWPDPPFTTVATTPISREKPFLKIDAHGHYSVTVPALAHNTAGVTWHNVESHGRSIPLSRFFVALPGRDSARTMNAALRKGMNLLLLPGTFQLTAPLHVTHPGTVVLGLGFATLRPTAGTPAIIVADTDGVTLSSLLIDAGPIESPSLVEIGTAGRHARRSDNPVSLHDLFFRVGGAGAGRTRNNLVVHRDGTLIDHTWIWRADHGNNVGWTQNTSDTGLFVDGNDVTAYGLFVEHHQKYQVIWKGERGRTFFYQSEIPYDPPTQTAWRSSPDTNGWASYKVDGSVRQHQAFALGIYSVFLKPNVSLTRAIEVPDTQGVVFEHMITVSLLDKGEISNIINNRGGETHTKPRVTPKLTRYPQ